MMVCEARAALGSKDVQIDAFSDNRDILPTVLVYSQSRYSLLEIVYESFRRRTDCSLVWRRKPQSVNRFPAQVAC